MEILKALPRTQRSWYGFGRLPGHARFQLRLLALPAVLRVRFFLKFPYWLLMNYGKAPGSHRGTEGMAMAAPPCCPRPLALDRAVKEDVCHTSDVVPLCPCTVMYSQRLHSAICDVSAATGDLTPKSEGDQEERAACGYGTHKGVPSGRRRASDGRGTVANLAQLRALRFILSLGSPR